MTISMSDIDALDVLAEETESLGHRLTAKECRMFGRVAAELRRIQQDSSVDVESALMDPTTPSWELIRRRLADRCTADSNECVIRRQCTNKCGRLQELRDAVSPPPILRTPDPGLCIGHGQSQAELIAAEEQAIQDSFRPMFKDLFDHADIQAGGRGMSIAECIAIASPSKLSVLARNTEIQMAVSDAIYAEVHLDPAMVARIATAVVNRLTGDTKCTTLGAVPDEVKP